MIKNLLPAIALEVGYILELNLSIVFLKYILYFYKEVVSQIESRLCHSLLPIAYKYYELIVSNTFFYDVFMLSCVYGQRLLLVCVEKSVHHIYFFFECMICRGERPLVHNLLPAIYPWRQNNGGGERDRERNVERERVKYNSFFGFKNRYKI